MTINSPTTKIILEKILSSRSNIPKAMPELYISSKSINGMKLTDTPNSKYLTEKSFIKKSIKTKRGIKRYERFLYKVSLLSIIFDIFKTP
jgi:hypothetical protein